ncbi:MAG: hypothetical protein V3T74_04000 [Gemmatimonadales bacterium]
MIRAAAAALLATLLGAHAAFAQLPSLRGYYQNVPIWSDATGFAVGGISDFNRLRLMTTPVLGEFSLQVAYEQFLVYSQRTEERRGLIFGSVVPSGGEWLDLQWTIKETDHIDWRHRFDRLNLEYVPNDILGIIVGRQAISWATTLLLTPADPFSPFNPSDPFREYRAGVDAVRVQVFPGPLSSLDLVVRPTKTTTFRGIVKEQLTALGRGQTVWKNWEVSGWGGVLYDQPALAIGASGSVGSVALRGEASLREDDGNPVLRAAIDLERLFKLLGRDLYVLLEYQHDGFGASGPREYPRVVTSAPFARGELQVLGQDEIAGQTSWQLHPLWATSLLVLWNLNDGSALLVPGASYSASNEVTLQAGMFLGLGDDTPQIDEPIPSEYGIVPVTLYLALSAFF